MSDQITPMEARTARQVMSTPAIACRPETFLDEVAEVLAQRAISGLVVVNDEGAVVGVVSERDIASAIGSPLVRLALKIEPRGVVGPRGVVERVEDVMTRSPIVAAPDTPAATLAEIMYTRRINRVPIVEDGRLQGVVTRTDLVKAVAGLTAQPAAPARPVVLGSGTLDSRPPLRGLHH